MNVIEEHVCFGGTLSVYEHESAVLGCAMRFSVFLPPQARDGDVPVLTYLSGLTCTHDNFTTKAGAYGFAAVHGLAIVAPDTSPRGDAVPDDAAYDFGQGAGFYINATQSPWAEHFQMEDYIAKELNALVCDAFPVRREGQGITGHSMGGHGALTLGLKYPALYHSISAFAPIVAPSQVPWGQKAFAGYLGEDKEAWLEHDACALMTAAGDRSFASEILIDQGGGDDFLAAQLRPELFEDACAKAGQGLRLRIHAGYDHSYYFIQSFVEAHIAHHAGILK
ncbi:MAG: S-formylglutathione hydrolase [Alphaproteobacteria bacterium]